MNSFTLIRPRTIDEAAREAAKPNTEMKAGGVDLVDRMKEGLDAPATIVSLSDIPGRDAIAAGPPARIGTMATLARIAADSGLRGKYPALADAAAGAATPQIRHMATIGGNLAQRPRCWYYRSADFECRKKGGSECYAIKGENRFHAIFDTDLLCCCVHPSATGTALLAYGATLETVSAAKGKRKISMEQFFNRPTDDATRENNLAYGEIIETIEIPAPPDGTRAVYRKLKEKESFDWPIVETCVLLTMSGGAVRDARVVFGSVAPTPRRSPEAEAVLKGAHPSDDLARRAAEAAVHGAKPMTQNAYKVRLARVELERAIRQAWA
jgi:xanthine dehydrogenase YagS FAD-binding subunit